jgi:hypothetical protein
VIGILRANRPTRRRKQPPGFAGGRRPRAAGVPERHRSRRADDKGPARRRSTGDRRTRRAAGRREFWPRPSPSDLRSVALADRFRGMPSRSPRSGTLSTRTPERVFRVTSTPTDPRGLLRGAGQSPAARTTIASLPPARGAATAPACPADPPARELRTRRFAQLKMSPRP